MKQKIGLKPASYFPQISRFNLENRTDDAYPKVLELFTIERPGTEENYTFFYGHLPKYVNIQLILI